MADPFSQATPGLDSPASNAVAVTPDDATDLATSARFLYIGVAGDVTVDLVRNEDADNPVTFTNYSGGIFPFRVKRVRATGTTATSIIAAW